MSNVRPIILALRAEGWSYLQIERHLNAQGIKAPRGGRWYHSTVRTHSLPTVHAAYQRDYQARRRNGEEIRAYRNVMHW